MAILLFLLFKNGSFDAQFSYLITYQIIGFNLVNKFSSRNEFFFFPLTSVVWNWSFTQGHDISKIVLTNIIHQSIKKM